MTTLDDIQPGDVLLFHGNSLISWAIRLFDGGDVNHAAIAMSGGQLAEAAGQGLQLASIATEVGSNEFTEVRRRLDLDLTDVTGRATRYVTDGHQYAYQQIFLLALLGITRRIPAPWAARRLLRSALDHAASALSDLVPTGRSRMICSEFVYRVYAEASTAQPNPYLLAIDMGATFAGDDDTLLAEALRSDDRPLTDVVGPTFAEPSAPFDADAAERELNDLIADYADAAESAGVPVGLPAGAVTVAPTFGADAAPPKPEPTEDEMLRSMAAFGLALQDTAGGNVSPTFGVITDVTLHGALQGIVDVSVDPNFVTPRDLAMSKTLTTIGRIP
jgi:hypothetical protein